MASDVSEDHEATRGSLPKAIEKMKPLEWPFRKLYEKANGSWFPSNETKLFAALKVSFAFTFKVVQSFTDAAMDCASSSASLSDHVVWHRGGLSTACMVVKPVGCCAL